MAKLTGKKKQQFLARLNKGRRAKGLPTIKSKTKSAVKKAVSKVRSKSKRSSSNTTKRSVRSVARQKTRFRSRGRFNTSAKTIAKKAGIGAGIGIVIRLGTMFFQDRKIREAGQRAAAVGATVGGGGTIGEAAYQAADAALSRLIPLAAGNGNGGGVTIPNPLAGGA